MFALNSNILVRYNMLNKHAELIGHIPKETTSARRLVAKLLVFNDQLLLVPCNASEVWIYDLKRDIWIDVGFEEKGINFKFATAFIHDSKAVMIGCRYDGIVVYDFMKKELKYYKKPYDKWRQYNSIDIYCRDYAFSSNNTVLLPSCVTNEVAEINIETMEVLCIHSIGDETNRYESIAVIGNECWITPRVKGDMVIWNGYEVIEKMPVKMKDGPNVCHYCGIIEENKKVYLFADMNAMSGYCDRKNREFKWEDQSYLFCHKDTGIVLVQNKDEEIIVIANSNVERIPIREIHIKGFDLYYEMRAFALDSFIEEIISE